MTASRPAAAPEAGRAGVTTATPRTLRAINDAAALELAEEHATAVVADITGRVLAEQRIDVEFASDGDPVPVVRQLLTDTARRAGVRFREIAHVTLAVSAAYDAAGDSLTFAAHIPGWARPGVLARLRTALRTEVVVD